MPTDFDPRQAALQYAASVEAYADRMGGSLAAGEALHALMCGLLYIGDQVRAATERPTALQLVLPNAEAVSAWRALEPEPEQRPVASKAVKVISCGSDVELELDGERFRLNVGDSLTVDGLAVRVVG